MQTMENDELAQYLESLKRESCYRVDATLKQSDHEVTQRVYFVGGNAAKSGPYIRKFIREEAGLGAAYLRIFEAQRAGKRFRHLPDILDCYSREGQLVVIMEYVQGDTLQEAVDRDGPSTELSRHCFPQVCDAVEELHEQFDPRIIHRDLKPSNIILTGQEIVLIDFGISREYREESESDTHHFGTREYAPPEQFGFGQTGVYSDVYALGMVLFFCLTGRIPTTQDRTQGFRNANVPESLRAVIAQAVALDPADRFASAAELKGAFLDALPDKALLPDQASPSYNERSATRKRNAMVGTLAVICAAALCAIAVFSVGSNDNAAVNNGEPSAASADATAGGEDTNTATGDEEAGSTTPTQSGPADSVQIQAPARNGFDEKTNFSATTAGVAFQIPEYFKARTSQADGNFTYYYAESGSSSAMIMTAESEVENADIDVSDEDRMNELKDSYLQGSLQSESLEELESYADCLIAGYPGRIATINGHVSGLPAKMTVAFFYNPDLKTIGSVTCGQTTNARYDYTDDFANVIASANRAK